MQSVELLLTMALFGVPLALASCSEGARVTVSVAPSAATAKARMRASMLPPSAKRADEAEKPTVLSSLQNRVPELSAAAQLGRELFFDVGLSASGKVACATCHDPQHAYGPPDGRAAQLGGPEQRSVGERAVPSLRYKDYTPPYADLLDNPDGMSAPGPGGGFAWDGRAPTLAEQAKLPLLSGLEMANRDAADVVAKVRKAPYAARFERAFGGTALADTERAFGQVLEALQAFQLEDSSFHPYSSKFDLHAGNKLGGEFTAAEARGFKVFADPKLGNCASCHFSGAGLNGSSALFTDFSYEAIGVPRNPELPATADPKYFDLGLCGPLRADHQSREQAQFCGMFKTPTLRNVATRSVFFHNGVLHSLDQVLEFYNTRDTSPGRWYPQPGKARQFDDLPPPYRANIDTQMPLDGRKPGSAPPMTARQLADLKCFLQTLTDDYLPPAASARAGLCLD